MFFDDQQSPPVDCPPAPGPRKEYNPEEPWLYQMVEQLTTKNETNTLETHTSWKDLRHTLRHIIGAIYERHNQPISADALLAEMRRTKGTTYVEVDIKLLVLLLSNLDGCMVTQQRHGSSF